MNKENLPQVFDPEPSTSLAQESKLVARYAKQSKAANTWKSYQSDFADFKAWCMERGVSAQPAAPGDVDLYLTHLA